MRVQPRGRKPWIACAVSTRAAVTRAPHERESDQRPPFASPTA